MEWAGTVGVLARIGAALSVSPPFASIAVPRRVRAILALALTIAISHQPAPVAITGFAFWLAIASEILIGLTIGLSISLVFSAATWAGDVISSQLGLNLSEAYDPNGVSEGTPLGQAWRMLAIVVFLAANGHHILIRGLYASFDTLPAMSATTVHAAGGMFIGLLQSATVLAVQLAAPVFIATLIADVAIGLLGRTIPQLGVLTAGVTLRSVLGLCIIIAGVAMTAAVLQGATINWMQLVQSAIGALAK